MLMGKRILTSRQQLNSRRIMDKKYEEIPANSVRMVLNKAEIQRSRTGT